MKTQAWLDGNSDGKKHDIYPFLVVTPAGLYNGPYPCNAPSGREYRAGWDAAHAARSQQRALALKS